MRRSHEALLHKKKFRNFERSFPEKGMEVVRGIDLLVSLMKQSGENENQAI
jgi:hypothetical protein